MFAALDTFNVSVFFKGAWDSIGENIKTAAKRL
jgi:hypothetical protein